MIFLSIILDNYHFMSYDERLVKAKHQFLTGFWKEEMPVSITMDELISSSIPRSMDDILVDLDRPNWILPEQLAEINALEVLLHSPSANQLSTVEAETALVEPYLDLRELLSSVLTFSVEASCQVIALAAAMPFVPKLIGKPIYQPLVRRLFS